MSDSFPDFTKAEYLSPSASAQPVYETGVTADPLLLRSLVYGLAGAVLGSLLYALVGHWVQIGFVAIVVGGMVGTSMMRATGGKGGRRYQVAAVLLTYFAVALAFTLDVLWELARGGKDLGAWVPAHTVLLLLITLFGPFLALTHPISGLIDLLILFFGMQAAWRVTKGGQDFSRFNKPEPGSMLGLR